MSGKTATETYDDMRYDLRQQRAKTLAAFVMNIVSPYLDGENRAHKSAYSALLKAFYESGYEVLTDEMRAAAGLPPRDDKGWTPHELLALEQKRLELIMKPIVIPVGAAQSQPKA